MFKLQSLIVLKFYLFHSYDLYSYHNSPYCLLYISCNFSLESLVLDPMMIP